VQRTAYEEDGRHRGLEVPERRAENILAAAFVRGSSQRVELARLARTGETRRLPEALSACLTQRAEAMGEGRVPHSRLSRSQIEAIAESRLAVALRERFGLTQMETVVACAIADGLTYAEIAERLTVSYHTVHSHVKAIHAKARVKSNGRFLALIRRLEERE